MSSHLKMKYHARQGELNRLIDSLLHPLFDHDTAFMVIGNIFHSSVEKNPKVTVRKFARYTLPKIIEEILNSH